MPFPPALLAVLLLFLPLASADFAVADELDLSYYLPEGDYAYDPAVPKPSEVLGWEVGTWHVRHDQLVSYMKALAEASDRVTLQVTGHTHEQRELLLLTISSPKNLARIDALREEHQRLVDPRVDAPDTANMPVFVWMGYSVHGNEASGSNASLAVAYHLAAAQGPKIEEQLRDAVVLFDPSLNPDGLSRFAHWANMHRGRVLVGDPNHREHREAWPNGRTNHYWYDLNRDWALAQHPESRARLRQFHAWRPNVLTDHHEMGTNSTFFFQPGIPSRKHPLTPEKNVELTGKIAKFHAKALDRFGNLYYSEESFDDFYYGKGSTYPDAHGAVGILFEQASARGHLQKGRYGEVSFPFGVRNQAATSYSTLEGALAHRVELLDYQAAQAREAFRAGETYGVRGWVFGDAGDPARAQEMIEVLLLHQIEVYALGEKISLGGKDYEPGSAYVVPTAQPQFLLVRALFENMTTFKDNSFYDVSTWVLPHSFGLPSADLDSEPSLGERVESAAIPQGRTPEAETEAYARIFEWSGYYAPRALGRLLAADVRAHVTELPFEIKTDRGMRAFSPGAIVVPSGSQEVAPEKIDEIFNEIANEDGVDVYSVTTGLTPSGADLGSPRIHPLEAPRIALVVGSGASTYEAGQAWHLLDHRFHLPVVLLDSRSLSGVDLSDYTHLVMVGGRWRADESTAQKIQGWIRSGGVLIGVKGGADWAEKNILKLTPPEEKDEEKKEPRPYAERSADFAETLISGSIFEVELDLTHPLAFGYADTRLPVFRNSTFRLQPSKNPYATPVRYVDDPLISGFVSEENLEDLRGTPALIAESQGRGLVVRLVDDPNFRGVWYGTSKFLLNSIFFGPIVN